MLTIKITIKVKIEYDTKKIRWTSSIDLKKWHIVHDEYQSKGQVARGAHSKTHYRQLLVQSYTGQDHCNGIMILVQCSSTYPVHMNDILYRGILTFPGLTKKILHWIRLLIHHLGLSFPQVFLSSGMAVKTAKQVVAWGSTTVVEEATSHKICPELSPRHSRAAPCLSSHPHCLITVLFVGI